MYFYAFSLDDEPLISKMDNKWLGGQLAYLKSFCATQYIQYGFEIISFTGYNVYKKPFHLARNFFIVLTVNGANN